MAGHPVEQRAALLNRLLQKKGKSLGKPWRVRIRRLLSETFRALDAPKLDGARCQALEDQIVRELSWLDDPSSIEESALIRAYEATLDALESLSKPSFGHIPGDIDKEKQHFIDASADAPAPPKETPPLPILPPLPETDLHTQPPSAPETPALPVEVPTAKKKKKSKKSALRDILFSDDNNTAQDTASAPAEQPNSLPAQPSTAERPTCETREKPPEIGYFDIVHVQVRQAIRIHAAVKPVRIGRAGDMADLYAETVNARVERFIEVLSKPDSSIQFNSELTPGYEDELIENMPDRGLVLHPKKKKKSSSLF